MIKLQKAMGLSKQTSKEETKMASQSCQTEIFMPAAEWQRAKWEMYSRIDLRMCGFVRWRVTESMRSSANAPCVN